MSENVRRRFVSKNQKAEEAYRFVAKTLLVKSRDQDIRTIGITSSLTDQSLRLQATVRLAEELSLQDIPIHLILLGRVDPLEIQCPLTILETYDEDRLQSVLQQLPSDTLVLVSAPPIGVYARSLDCLALTHGIVLIERYGYTRFKEYENTIWLLKRRNIPAFGIITIR